MSLARVKVWNPGDVLTATDLNAEFNNILNNPISLISPTTGAINFNLQAHTGLLPSAFSATSGSTGNFLTVSSSGGVVFSPGNVGVAAPRVSGLQGTVTSSALGSFQAGFYVMRTTGFTQSWTVSATSSYTVNIGTAGPAANGRDIAGQFASTYIHWYAISTGPLSTAPAGLVSSNPPTVGPVAMPTSYSGWTYLGASPYSSASTTLLAAQTVSGSRFQFKAPNVDATLINAGTATGANLVTVSSVFPSNAMRMMLQAALSITAGAANTFQGVTLGSDNTLSTSVYTVLSQNQAQANQTQTWIHPELQSTALFYGFFSSAGATGSVTIYLLGYSAPNGGE